MTADKIRSEIARLEREIVFYQERIRRAKFGRFAVAAKAAMTEPIYYRRSRIKVLRERLAGLPADPV